MQEILVLGVKRYGFTNDGGEKVEGTNIVYIEGFDYSFDEVNMKGVFPMNVTNASMDFFEKFQEVPAYYNVVFRQRPDKKGKPVSVPVEAKFSRPLFPPAELKVAK